MKINFKKHSQSDLYFHIIPELPKSKATKIGFGNGNHSGLLTSINIQNNLSLLFLLFISVFRPYCVSSLNLSCHSLKKTLKLPSII